MNSLISDDYLDLNAQLHSKSFHYGMGAWKWTALVIYYMRKTNADSLLDYGSGKGTLGKWVRALTQYQINDYDPVTAPQTPDPADFVACLDVLEHIEPEHLEAVLADLRAKTRKAGLFVVSTRAAHKNLPDGRNAHLIVENRAWWWHRLRGHFSMVQDLGEDHPEYASLNEVVFYVEP